MWRVESVRRIDGRTGYLLIRDNNVLSVNRSTGEINIIYFNSVDAAEDVCDILNRNLLP